jgi:hypothetical protein
MTIKATDDQWNAAQAYEKECWTVTHTTSENDRSEYYDGEGGELWEMRP